mmetsp:Transcript_13064/g.23851  ORF Transcript_13064/g.23851 Transcript_13064/m.23851 type:complete len:244 (-) Transcript_13064:91-822(-)
MACGVQLCGRVRSSSSSQSCMWGSSFNAFGILPLRYLLSIVPTALYTFVTLGSNLGPERDPVSEPASDLASSLSCFAFFSSFSRIFSKIMSARFRVCTNEVGIMSLRMRSSSGSNSPSISGILHRSVNCDFIDMVSEYSSSTSSSSSSSPSPASAGSSSSSASPASFSSSSCSSRAYLKIFSLWSAGTYPSAVTSNASSAVPSSPTLRFFLVRAIRSPMIWAPRDSALFVDRLLLRNGFTNGI